MSRARVETRDGRRKLSDEHRAKMSAAAKARYDALTPEQQAASLARIGRKPKAAAAPAPAAGGDPPERRSPLAMTPLELVRSVFGRR